MTETTDAQLTVHAQYFTPGRLPTGEAACGALPDSGGVLADFGAVMSVTCRECMLVIRERGLSTSDRSTT